MSQVSQIIAGTNIEISPLSGTGNVTINNNSSTITKCASFARTVSAPLEATGPAIVRVGLGSISFDAGPTPTDGFIIFSVNILNNDPTNSCSASVALTNNLTGPLLIAATQVQMDASNAQQVTLMYPLVNISGPQTIYGFASQGSFPAAVNPLQTAVNPSWSVVWGGNASIQQG
jgi:hypothetical protein